MSDYVLYEKDFQCPCGKGIHRVQLLERDTRAGGCHRSDTILCDECGAEYVELTLQDAFVLRGHAEEIERRRHEINERRRTIGDKAAGRYLSQIKEHVNRLKFKTSMENAISGKYENMGNLYKGIRFEREIGDAIEREFKDNPADGLRKLNVEDGEMAAELQAIAEEDAALQRFLDEIPKHPLPQIVEPYTCLPQALTHLRLLQRPGSATRQFGSRGLPTRRNFP